MLTKLDIMKKFGFYPSDIKENETESCGAHSAKLSGPLGAITKGGATNRCI